MEKTSTEFAQFQAQQVVTFALLELERINEFSCVPALSSFGHRRRHQKQIKKKKKKKATMLKWVKEQKEETGCLRLENAV